MRGPAGCLVGTHPRDSPPLARGILADPSLYCVEIDSPPLKRGTRSLAFHVTGPLTASMSERVVWAALSKCLVAHITKEVRAYRTVTILIASRALRVGRVAP